MNKKIIFKKIEMVYIFGWGESLINFANLLKKTNFKFKILLHPKQSHMPLPGSNKSFIKTLFDNNLDFATCQNIKKFEKNLIDKYFLLISFGSYFQFNIKFVKKNPYKLYNFMPIPMPRYRGGAHWTWAMMKNEKYWGCNIQEIDEFTKEGGFIDTGKILFSANYKIKKNILTPTEFVKYISKKEKIFLSKFIHKLKNKSRFILKPINESRSIFLPRIKTEKDGWVDWNWSSKEIILFINSFSDPYRGASALINNKRVFLQNAKKINDENFHPFQSSLIVRKYKNRLFVLTSSGLISIDNISNSMGKNIFGEVKIGQKLEKKI